MKKIYIVQMKECEVTEESTSAIEHWEEFYDYTYDLEEAKKQANELVRKIKEHKVEEIFQTNSPDNLLSVVISEYDEETNSIINVIEVADIKPSEWNVKCGDCGAYCDGGTCFKYGDRVNVDTFGCDRWHEL